MKRFGLSKKKAEVDDEFIQQQKITATTKSVCESAVKQVMPDSGGVLGLFGGKKISEEEKRGQILIDDGQKLNDACAGQSPFGKSLIATGQTLKQVGEASMQLDHSIVELTVTPLRQFLDNNTKGVYALEKKMDTAASQNASAKKAVEKRNEPDTQAALRRTEEDLEESKTAYFNAMRALQETETERIRMLQAYAAEHIAFYEKALRAYTALASELQDAESQRVSLPPSRSASSVPSSGGGAKYELEEGAFAGGFSKGPPPSTPSSYSAPAPPSHGGGGPPPLPPSVPSRAPPAPAQQRCVALYDFQGQDEKELTFSAGDEIVVVRKISDDWMEGNFRGRVGIFPTNYVSLS